ncbi:hypothetical protein D8M04_19560 [Oceanobacillus piezotolerans]|uniref:DUF3955 domain-containing protein n=1 Tax=Oceanobacillus piezotolerans TaxID=2448030 RepID=A0A498D436_9BACI|nr:hypothetical protein [Oceanobacillus piezotolerans]RLL39984.1 hypothetical protein D8M04_19560 [Oceanobacillus piezotolerans]
MKNKLLWFPLLASLLSIGILYTIGNIFEISFLSWNFYKENPSEGVIFEAEVSVIPVIIGLILGFITERILKNKHKRNSHLV